MPHINGILETGLYVADVERSAQFYERLFGLKRMVGDDRFCALAVTPENSGGHCLGRGVLLLFKQGGTLQPIHLPGGVIPPHDGSGQSHFAFAISAEDLEAWEKRLIDAGIAIESRVRWAPGGESLYFRDPDGHLAELATPGIWPIY